MFVISRVLSKAAVSKMLKISLLIAVVYLLFAAALIYWPSTPAFEVKGVANAGPLPVVGEPVKIQARDDTTLFAQQFGVQGDTVAIWLHGITSESSDHAKGAAAFHAATGALVLVIDQRGHARSGGEPYDIDYIGQYEDDVEDWMVWASARFGDPRIILVGHSMGGGVLARYALKDAAPEPDGYLLLAPSFGEAPTQREDSGDGPDLSQWVHFRTPRLFGLLMLNVVGITALDSLPLMSFNEPTGVSQYSYRATMSGQPIRPLTADIALQGIKAPLLVVVGADDEVFVADAYADFVAQHSAGETVVLPDLDHNQVVDDPAAIAVMSAWFERVTSP